MDVLNHGRPSSGCDTALYSYPISAPIPAPIAPPGSSYFHMASTRELTATLYPIQIPPTAPIEAPMVIPILELKVSLVLQSLSFTHSKL